MGRPLIALDALVLRPRLTGVSRAILDWTAALAEADRGCDFAVLCAYPELLGHLAERPGWRLVPCPGARGGIARKAIFTQTALPGLLRRLPADLLHCFGFIVPLCAPCPTVATVFDLGFRLFPSTIERPRRLYYRCLVPRSLRSAAAIVCCSEATAADVKAWLPELAARVHVTPLGVPTWVNARARGLREAGDAAPFLFVGTLEPRKNLERLLRAYQALRRQRRQENLPCPPLVLVGGRGWQDGPLRRVLAPLVAEGSVVAMDYCSDDELWRQYGLARALLAPSLMEGFGLPILEAMAAGLPVMTGNRGAMAEVAGDAALLVDPLDEESLRHGMQRLLDEPALGRELAARGRDNLRRWTWRRTASTTCEVYRNLLGHSAESSPARGGKG